VRRRLPEADVDAHLISARDTAAVVSDRDSSTLLRPNVGTCVLRKRGDLLVRE